MNKIGTKGLGLSVNVQTVAHIKPILQREAGEADGYVIKIVVRFLPELDQAALVHRLIGFIAAQVIRDVFRDREVGSGKTVDDVDFHFVAV